MTPVYKRELLQFFLGFVSENKQQLFNRLIQFRTRHITVVLEDIYQPHNASAVLRTCDCFGIQDVHIIENRNRYQVNPDVALGSAQWLTMMRYNNGDHNTLRCLEALHASGYLLAATTPHEQDVIIDEMPIDKKTALLFGTELRGLSDEALRMADLFVRIPMFGFTESFNISVSAALCLYPVVRQMHRSGIDWHLSEEEQLDVLLSWARNVVREPDLLEKEFIRRSEQNESFF
jgi:tRNA (guanosine-2'-O-)-methyltransferase